MEQKASVQIRCFIVLWQISRLLHTETKLAELIGLERLFRVAMTRNFINEFSLWHPRQLDDVDTGILKDFGEVAVYISCPSISDKFG